MNSEREYRAEAAQHVSNLVQDSIKIGMIFGLVAAAIILIV